MLAVSDEVDAALSTDLTPVRGVELILACGDLPFEYLGYLMDGLDVPLVFVPGNHDPDVSGYTQSRAGIHLRAGLPESPPWPPGAVNADGRVVTVAGLRIAGLGGSVRYSDGPNQYTEREQTRRARRLVRRAHRPPWRRRPIDVLMAHAPPRGHGDGDDPPHRGFEAVGRLAERLAPPVLLHGHIHPYGQDQPDRTLGRTLLVNVVPRRIVTVEPATLVYTENHASAHRLPPG